MHHLVRSRVAVLAFVTLAFLGTGISTLPASAAPSPAASVTVISRLNPSSYGQAVKLIATVTDPATPTQQLTGSMTFADGAAVLGTSTVSSGVASLSTRSLTGGDHPITATYTPTTGGPSVASSPIVQHVHLGSSTTTVSTTNANVLNGRPGAIKAKVRAIAPAFGVPTGSVDFYLDPYDPANPVSPYLTEPLDATGTATFDFAFLYGPGTYDVTAVYRGDASFAGSFSTMLTQTVRANAPIASAAFSPTTVAVGASSRLTISATNTTPYAMRNVALGVLTGGRISVVSAPPGALCGARPGLYYCLISVPAGATRSLVLQVTPLAPGTVTASSYARNNDTGDETYAAAMLTAQ